MKLPELASPFLNCDDNEAEEKGGENGEALGERGRENGKGNLQKREK